MFRRIFSTMLAFVMVFALVPSASAASSTYNSNAALTYARAHWDDGKDLCDGFVRRCLNAGGCPVTAHGCSAMVKELKNTKSPCSKFGEMVKLTVESNGYIRADKNVGKVSAGDPLFLYCPNHSGTNYTHAVLCGGADASGYLTCYAHNEAKNNARLYTKHCGYCKANTISAVYAFHMTPVLSMRYNVNGGQVSSTEYKATSAGTIQKGGSDFVVKWDYNYGHQNGLTNRETFGLSRSGYVFKGWSLSKDGSSRVFGQSEQIKSQDIYSKLSSGSASVTLYAVWVKDTPVLSMRYNVNGGKISSTEYKATSAGTIQKGGSDFVVKWDYNYGHQNGLTNRETFGLSRSGYVFKGWSLSKDGSTRVFGQTEQIKSQDIYTKLSSGSATVTLYAIWAKQPAVLSYEYENMDSEAPTADEPNAAFEDVSQAIVSNEIVAYENNSLDCSAAS